MVGHNPFIVSADWLEKNLGKPGLVVVDASLYLSSMGRDGRQEYEKAHIPSAVFFDHDEIRDKSSCLPNMIPSAADFSRAVGALGIARNSTIVIYDGPGFFSAPRAWWLFRLMGAEKVSVLDGGFDNWRQQGRPVTAEVTPVAPVPFEADFQGKAVVLLDEMRDLVARGDKQIADARGAGRFSGQGEEPRKGMRSGHMPGACNVPFSLLSAGGYWKPAGEIRAIFNNAGIDPDKPVVTSCGSGVTAAVLTLALQSLGNEKVRLYDGSWSEWGSLTDTPVETGNAS